MFADCFWLKNEIAILIGIIIHHSVLIIHDLNMNKALKLWLHKYFI